MKNIIGILGGMGPEASCHLYKKILEYCQQEYCAVQDDDYPRIVVNSLSLRGFSEEGVVKEDLVKSQLVQGVQMLQNAFCDYIIIACNTVHIYYDDMQDSVYTPIINVVKEVSKAVQQSGHKKVGLLCSTTTRDLGLYQKELAEQGVEALTSSDQQQYAVSQVIKHVMAGQSGLRDIQILQSIIESFIQGGATAIVLGCTELPLAIGQIDIPIPEFNANDILVKTVVDNMHRPDK